MKDRCFWIPTQDGKGKFRIRAEKRPDKRTTEALQKLFTAARTAYSTSPREEARVDALLRGDGLREGE